MSNGQPLLSVDNVQISYLRSRPALMPAPGPAPADDPEHESFRFDIHRGESVALVGPSGAGKTSLALALTGLLPPAASVVGSARFDGVELFELSAREWVDVRGNRIALIMQDPAGWLDPVQHIDDQVAEAVRANRAVSRSDAHTRARELLDRVGLADSKRTLRAFPHELSGGMQQRVAIAIALAGEPDLLIADEPTSALDATVQIGVLDLLEALRSENDMALLLVTHDSNVVKYLGQRVVDVQRVAPTASTVSTTSTVSPVRDRNARQRSSRGGPSEPDGPALLEATGLRKRFGRHVAVDGVDIRVEQGEIVGLVGESGSGKTTVARMLLGLEKPDVGSVYFAGENVTTMRARGRRAIRARIQFVAQNSYGSLDPRMTVGRIVEEPLIVHGRFSRETPQQVNAILQAVGIDPSRKSSYPRQFSGGERQRVAIARALVLRPRLVVLDEPLTGLDARARDDVLELLDKLRSSYGLAFLLIAHDLETIATMAHRVVVMADGKVVEEGMTDAVFDSPVHPRTRQLLAASLSLRRLRQPSVE